MLALVINSAVGLYYYLRVVVAMFTPQAEAAGAPRIPLPAGVALLTLTVLLIWLGVHPTPLVRLIQATVGSLL